MYLILQFSQFEKKKKKKKQRKIKKRKRRHLYEENRPMKERKMWIESNPTWNYIYNTEKSFTNNFIKGVKLTKFVRRGEGMTIKQLKEKKNVILWPKEIFSDLSYTQK